MLGYPLLQLSIVGFEYGRDCVYHIIFNKNTGKEINSRDLLTWIGAICREPTKGERTAALSSKTCKAQTVGEGGMRSLLRGPGCFYVGEVGEKRANINKPNGTEINPTSESYIRNYEAKLTTI